MKAVIAPIKQEENGEVVINLQGIIQTFVDREIIKISKDEWDKIGPDFKGELEKQFYGKLTARLVQLFREQNKLGDGSDVDEATAKAINERLNLLPEKPAIKGTVLSADRKPVPDTLVKVFKNNIRRSDAFGEAYTNAEGSFEITYSLEVFDPAEKGNPGLIVVAYDKAEVEISRATGSGQENIDVFLPDPDANLSEFERLTRELWPLMKDLAFEELSEKDIEFLTANSKFPKEMIISMQAAFVTASRFPEKDTRTAEKNSRIPAAVFYGWSRMQLPANPRDLFALSADELIQSMQKAIGKNIIPETLKDSVEKIRIEINQLNAEILLQPTDNASPSLGDILNTIPEALPFDKQILVARIIQDKSNLKIPIGERLKEAGLEEREIKSVEKTLALQSFSDGFIPLIKTLQKENEINSLRDLALNLNKEELARKIINDKAYPENENAEEFTDKLYNRLFQAEPTAVVRNMLVNLNPLSVDDPNIKSGVASFLSRLPETYDIKKTSVLEAFKNETAFEGIAPELHGQVKTQLRSLQRVAAIAPVAEAIPVLMNANATSAFVVSDIPESQFVRMFSQQFATNGEAIARQIHTNAVNARIRNEQALISFKEVQQGTGISMIDKSMRNGFDANDDFRNVLVQNNLSWDSLFGDANFCECDECSSVYSAACYFVDLLQYLRNNNLDPNETGQLEIRLDPKDISGTPLQKLFDRRPDLKCLQLTCKNTNTILPYVDLVNEVMESYVTVYHTLPFNVAEEETSGELLAEPHHTEIKAYEILSEAVYPFVLPFHQPIDAARIYLDSLGTSRHELLDIFRAARNKDYVIEPFDNPEDSKIPLLSTAANLDQFNIGFLDAAVDAEYLGLTQEEFVLLTKEAFVSKDYWDDQNIVNGQIQPHSQQDYFNKTGAKELYQYYGYDQAHQADMLSDDEGKKLGLTFVKEQFLKRSGVEYVELVELLKTQSLNPYYPKGQALSIMESIPFSYTFLNALVNKNANSKEEKFGALIAVLLSLINRKVDDPCLPEKESTELTETQVKQRREDLTNWVYNDFEDIGNIIVLDNGTKSIDGDLGSMSNNFQAAFLREGYIKNSVIYGESGEVIGTVNKSTGLITLESGQPERDWTKMYLTSNTVAFTRFLNVFGKYYLVSFDPAPDACNIDTVRLVHLNSSPLLAEEYDHMHRFIRLWRKLGWTIDETDNAIISLGNNSFDITRELLHQLAAVKKLQLQTGVELIKLICFWTNIPTTGEQSLYKRLFLTHNLLGIDNIFQAVNGRYLAVATINISDHIPVLMAAFNLKAGDIEAIMQSAAIKKLTIENVSLLFRFRSLSKMLGLRIADLISILPLFKDPFADADSTLIFLEQWNRIEDAGFNYAQLNYIIQGIDDPQKPLSLPRKTLLQLTKKLTDGIAAIQEAHQDLHADAGTTDPTDQQKEIQSRATSEMIKEKASLLYDQGTVENILGVLEGTTTYSVDCPAAIKDGLRYVIPPAPVVPYYEELTFDNYPLVKKRIRYDGTNGSLQVKGILPKFNRQDSIFAKDDFALAQLIGRLKKSNPDLVSGYVWNTFSQANQNILNNGATVSQQQEIISFELNKLITGGQSIYDAVKFAGVSLSIETKILKDKNPTDDEELIDLNRMLLEDAYPMEIAKTHRIGLGTILQNLQPADALDASLENIKTQQHKLIDEIFKGIFSQAEIDFFAGEDINDRPIDPVTNTDDNSAPAKRLKFLETFLPYLRKELAHRFIIKTLSDQTGLPADVTELLTTRILKKDLITPVSLQFENINQKVEPNYKRWKGTVTPATDGTYSFIVRDSYTRPVMTIDGQTVRFTTQSNALDEWKSDEQQLLAQQYRVELYRNDPENVFWNDSGLSIAQAPGNFLLSGWEGFLNPTADGKYIFIVKGVNTAPIIAIDGSTINFPAQANADGEWWSDKQDLLAGQSFKLTLASLQPAQLTWKTPDSTIAPIPSSVLLSGWKGYLIPSAGEQYTFIIKGSRTMPDLDLDSDHVQFIQQPNSPGEWWSSIQKLQAGKVYELFIPEINLENLYWKTSTSAVTSIPSTSLVSIFAEHECIKAFTPLHKTALLINGFALSADEIEYLSDHASDFEVLDFNKISFAHFLRLESYTRLRNYLPKAKINILEFFEWTYHQDSTPLSEKIEGLTNWKKELVEQITSPDHFNLSADSFHNETNLLKLRKAIGVANKININVDSLFDWAKPNVNFTNALKIAGGIQHSIRAQYNREDWEQLVKPLNDKLRENQKNALIAYLLVQPGIMNWGVKDADGLFEYFLIDVQMDACMETSRIKQAISSVQLFIQRCFLGLESRKINLVETGVSINILDRDRWEWMQRYRIWEANKKVFLYPENWIESNLRDDKTAFFKELESELLQKDINRQNVEDALKNYLFKVDEVANMEVVGVHIEMVTSFANNSTTEKAQKLHVFSRTRNAPYFFYYRYLDLQENNWYPWEKMQVDIPCYDLEELVEVKFDPQSPTSYSLNKDFKKILGNGCYLTPVVWNGRLLVFFPQFMKKTKAPDDVAGSKTMKDLSEDATDGSKPVEYWEIKMAWSEYRNGKWTQKQISVDAIYDIPAPDDFWKKFNDANKAWSLYTEAARKYNRIVKDNGVKWNRWNAARGTGNESNLFNTYAIAYDQEVQALEDRDNARHDFFDIKKPRIDSAKDPLTASSIAYYEFVPVKSDAVANTDDLLGIKVYYKDPAYIFGSPVSKGVFEFNGSHITIPKDKNYSANNSITVNRFHHNAWLINSLQVNGDVMAYNFDDERESTYRFFNYATLGFETINFYHSKAHKFLGKINSQQLETFFTGAIAEFTDMDDAFGGYDDDNDSMTVDSYHELKRPYSIYNWELFFHTPMMIADALSKSQHFEDAMKWYHYVFNPMADGPDDKRFWQFIPFKDAKAKEILNSILSQLAPNKKNDKINEWRNHPFQPHLVARGRPVAYMKWVVMKYIDNLVAWGDYLFRQETIESINQATQLYILAGHILGPRPQLIPKRGKIKPQTYLSLLDKWDASSNAMAELEVVWPYSTQTPLPIGIGKGVIGYANVFGFASTTYFSIPDNPNLTAYWDTISDRLFKIRHCENIEGVFRKLPLFEPPIDPALLVKAAAQGISISSVMNELNTPMPNYRFYYLLQKALELCGELKSMGAGILSAIEKKENEAIALIRAKHESGMLNLIMEIKNQQLEEAQKSLDSLLQNRKSPEHRMRYYLQLIGEDASKVPGLDIEFSEIANAIEVPIDESGMKLIKYEKEDMDKANLSADMLLGAGITEALASILYIIPMIKADVAPMGIGAGAGFGGTNLGQLTQALSKAVQITAAHLSHQSSSASKKGGFLRAMQDRVMQANSAGYEIKQIDKQIVSQQIRIAIANLEITNHQKQIDNAQEVEEFLKNKFSSEELYSWMKNSLSTLYHQVYNLAFDLSKKAEKVFRFERGLTSSNFIQSGYWDAGYNGLLAGEQLYVALKQLEAAYQENRGYDYEVTKHVSLRQISPLAILQLKQTGACEFALPEVLFDMDYPGQFKRRIKSVSISVPCIAGPYTGVNGTLRLLENKFRNSALAKNANGYKEKTEDTDERFNSFIIPTAALAASSGQNDSGMFELNFKDERYLPFEGAGVISKWRFELPSFRQFDYNTISDLVMHIRYTSAEGGDRLKEYAVSNVNSYIRNIEEVSKDEGLFMLIDLKRDMPNEWHSLTELPAASTRSTVSLKIETSRLPLFTRNFDPGIKSVVFIARHQDPESPDNVIDIIDPMDPAKTISLHKDQKLRLYLEQVPDLVFDTAFDLSIDKDELQKIGEFIILVKYSLAIGESGQNA